MKMGGVSLFFQVDEFNITERAEVPLQPFLTEDFDILSVSGAYIPRRTGVGGECESGRERTGVLAPVDLQPTVVEGQALERSNLVEGHGGG